jgi:hypothetical protein
VRSVFLFFESWNAAESGNLKTHAKVSNKRAKARQTDTKEQFWRCNCVLAPLKPPALSSICHHDKHGF